MNWNSRQGPVSGLKPTEPKNPYPPTKEQVVSLARIAADRIIKAAAESGVQPQEEAKAVYARTSIRYEGGLGENQYPWHGETCIFDSDDDIPLDAYAGTFPSLSDACTWASNIVSGLGLNGARIDINSAGLTREAK